MKAVGPPAPSTDASNHLKSPGEACAGLDVVGFGALNLDKLIQVPTLENKDTEVKALAEADAPGGSAANTIYALARLGLRAGYVGAVGDDAAGRSVVRDLQEAKIETGCIKRKKGSITGQAVCLTDPKGQRYI